MKPLETITIHSSNRGAAASVAGKECPTKVSKLVSYLTNFKPSRTIILMVTVNIGEIKSKFSYYADLVKAGESIVVSKRNKPFAVLMPYEAQAEPKELVFGLMEGKFEVPGDFDAGIEEFELEYYAE